METNELEKSIAGLIQPVLDDLGVELYCIEVPGSKGRHIVRLFIEKEGGVTIDDCQRVSREVEAILDVEDPVSGSYTLEVSSPGLDRPLKRPEDFKKCEGKIARVITREPVDNQKFFVGEILEAGDDAVVMRIPAERKVIVEYKIISKARLEVNV